jgi:hypothetical protein
MRISLAASLAVEVMREPTIHFAGWSRDTSRIGL